MSSVNHSQSIQRRPVSTTSKPPLTPRRSQEENNNTVSWSTPRLDQSQMSTPRSASGQSVHPPTHNVAYRPQHLATHQQPHQIRVATPSGPMGAGQWQATAQFAAQYPANPMINVPNGHMSGPFMRPDVAGHGPVPYYDLTIGNNPNQHAMQYIRPLGPAVQPSNPIPSYSPQPSFYPGTQMYPSAPYGGGATPVTGTLTNPPYGVSVYQQGTQGGQPRYIMANPQQMQSTPTPPLQQQQQPQMQPTAIVSLPQGTAGPAISTSTGQIAPHYGMAQQPVQQLPRTKPKNILEIRDPDSKKLINEKDIENAQKGSDPIPSSGAESSIGPSVSPNDQSRNRGTPSPNTTMTNGSNTPESMPLAAAPPAPTAQAIPSVLPQDVAAFNSQNKQPPVVSAPPTTVPHPTQPLPYSAVTAAPRPVKQPEQTDSAAASFVQAVTKAALEGKESKSAEGKDSEDRSAKMDSSAQRKSPLSYPDSSKPPQGITFGSFQEGDLDESGDANAIVDTDDVQEPLSTPDTGVASAPSAAEGVTPREVIFDPVKKPVSVDIPAEEEVPSSPDVTPTAESSPHPKKESSPFSPNAKEFVPKGLSSVYITPTSPLTQPPIVADTPPAPAAAETHEVLPPRVESPPVEPPALAKSPSPEVVPPVVVDSAASESQTQGTAASTELPPLSEVVTVAAGPSPEPDAESADEEPPAEALSVEEAQFMKWTETLEDIEETYPEMFTANQADGKKSYPRELLILEKEIARYLECKLPQSEGRGTLGLQEGFAEVGCAIGTQRQMSIGGGGGGGNQMGSRSMGYMANKPNSRFQVGWEQQSTQKAPRLGNRPSYTGRNSRGGGKKPPVQVIARPSQVQVELRKAENAWKPLTKSGIELAPEEKLKNEARAILNKITPQTEQVLTEDFLKISINSEDACTTVIEVIFDKAVEEQGFCNTYSKLCKSVVNKEVEVNKKSVFRDKLLATCQKKFEGGEKEGQSNQRAEEEIVKTEDPDVRKKMQDELAGKISKERRRMFGNIRFIGELYQQELLIPIIIHSCIMELFKRIDNKKTLTGTQDFEALECLCRLLTTVGNKLAKEVNDRFKQQVPKYYERLSSISNSDVDNRIKFMIMDLLDLKNSNWKAKKQNLGPKKIEDIHKDYKNEKLKEHVENRAHEDRKRSGMGMIGPRGSQGGGRGGRGGYHGGSSMEGGRPQDRTGNRAGKPEERRTQAGQAATRAGSQPEKVKSARGLRDTFVDPSNISLGPTKAWGNPKRKPGDNSNRQQTASPTPTSSRDSSQTRDKQSALNAVRGITGRGAEGGGGAWSRAEDRTTPPVIDSPVLPVVDDEERDRKLKGNAKEILHDLFTNGDSYLNDSVSEFEDNIGAENQARFVNFCISQAAEGKEGLRVACAKMLKKASNKPSLLEKIVDGVTEFVREAEELELEQDVPKVWEYLANMLRPIWETPPPDSTAVLDRLGDTLPDKVHKHLSDRSASSVSQPSLGHTPPAQSDQSASSLSNLDPRMVAVERLIKDSLKNVEPSEDWSSLEKGLDDVIALITTSYDAEELQQKEIVDQLVRGISDSVITGSTSEEDGEIELNADKLEKECRLLVRIIDGKSPSMYQTLDSIADFCRNLSYPKDLFEGMLFTLNDNSVISAQTFKDWWKAHESNAMFSRSGTLKRFFQENVE